MYKTMFMYICWFNIAFSRRSLLYIVDCMIKQFAFSLFILICFGSLKAQQKITPEAYILRYAQVAVDEMKRSGVPASITLAQGILESNSGNSTLARTANNHFGIKCHNDWNGEKVYHDDDHKNECFRKYNTPDQSFRDHSDFIAGKQRYARLFELKTTDYKGWANGLKEYGYATDRNYAARLIDIIERYNLNRFDDENIDLARIDRSKLVKTDPDNLVVDPFQPEIKENNRIQYVVAKEGDTFASLTKKYGLLPWQLPRYNDLPPEAQLKPGMFVYLQPKRNRAEAGFRYHIVKQGETMFEISQLYGIKLKKLYRKNRMEQGQEPVEGQKLWLRRRKPRNV